MPRWFFLICIVALVLSVIGGVLIVVRSPGDPPQVDPATGGTATAPGPSEGRRR